MRWENPTIDLKDCDQRGSRKGRIFSFTSFVLEKLLWMLGQFSLNKLCSPYLLLCNILETSALHHIFFYWASFSLDLGLRSATGCRVAYWG